ncbi:tRNA (mo5U34)-methyltransferase [Ferrimonas marina]|uniref:tRNA U34 carboxymethyltransferase n=2 Tax=Ferrimonas marina TaxID=299255 RepID=A0A1M5N094_9GAMM|nr:tRNA (mo5U34)-methyltransferase [Ferrimonas marina]
MDFSAFYKRIAGTRLNHWLESAPAQLAHWSRFHKNGDFPKWEKVLAKLPQRQPETLELKHSVTVGDAEALSPGEQKKLHNLLKCLQPWRKGPFDLYGIHIDTEWRSDWKWDRLLPHISPLKHRTVLDVGCGSGYHMWRMLGEGAELVIGVDPSDLFLAQFEAVRKLAGDPQDLHLLPLGIQQLPPLHAFDTVFSMGVLYHRRSPIDHLYQLQEQLKPGGELVLETLVIEGDENQVLVPESRYGKMNNVWYIPSSRALMLWLRKCGFINVRVVDEGDTTVAEQRSTEWMGNESLKDYLDPNDETKTVEGYPAPKRAIVIAEKAESQQRTQHR